jgi:hypothetical protein
MLREHWIEASGHAELWWLWLESFLLIVFSFQGLACYLTPVQYPLSFSYFTILLLLWADSHFWWCFLSPGIDVSNQWPFCEHGCSFFPLELEVGAAICSSVLNVVCQALSISCTVNPDQLVAPSNWSISCIVNPDQLVAPSSWSISCTVKPDQLVTPSSLSISCTVV